MNAHERAVIEAARAFREPDDISGWNRLAVAVEALDDHRMIQAVAGTAEIEWSLVAAGDELRGKSGAFFPVIRTRCEYDMGKTTGRYVIEVGMPGGPKSIVRPIESEPFATVKRGQDGRAVDEFVSVFSSGER